jgi:putative hydrolase of the HAD superfamily
MIKYITFDLWETLIADSPELDTRRTEYRVTAAWNVLKRKFENIDKGRILDAHQQVWEECTISWQKARDLAFNEQVGLFLNMIGKDILPALSTEEFKTISKAYAEAVIEHPPTLIEGVRETLENLSSKGLVMGLICNTGRSPGFVLRKLLEDYHILRFFECTLFSDETIVRKPDVEIFNKAVSELHASRDKMIHVGDSWENDILGAQKTGIGAVWISPLNPDKKDCTVIRSIAHLPDIIGEL